MLLSSGKPYPLGATVDDAGVNFALFSANATAVYLCLFDEDDIEIGRFSLPRQTQQIWHGHISEIGAGMRYGFRVDGPYQPLIGHRFNVNKLLLDPYAKQFAGEFVDDKLHYGYQFAHKDEDLSFCSLDNAALMPKCVVVDTRNLTPIVPLAKPYNQEEVSLSLRRSVIYETHVKGFTRLHPEVDKALRGTFAGLASPAVISYLSQLGITAVELLPSQQFISEAFLQEKQLSNYWGYNTIGFFAPHKDYLCQNNIEEFRLMVSEMHSAGIEVILDVVYNHTAEGNRLGPTFSFKGIDNASYYRLHPSEPRYYINDTGCGNTFNIAHPNVLQLVMDSLRYWVEVMGVDGFRFDLATTLGREEHGFDAGAGFFDAIKQDPVLSQVRLIAEPWDIGPGGYQLGQYPVGWSEWNDRYRDTVRRFWRGDAGMLPEFARRFHGSSDLFEHSGRKPTATINFITSHDGFTLMDLVSFRHKHNQANGEQNRDGHNENFSDNYGIEGATDDVELLALRSRQCRNMLTTLFLSQGVPMLLAGDEFGHSQKGNNNAYCQDNANSWINWQSDINRDALLDFTTKLIKMRRRFPLLCHREYIHESANENSPGLDWFCRQGEPMTKAHWGEAQTRTLSVVISGELEAQAGCRQALLLMLNADDQSHQFTLPNVRGIDQWQCLLTTQDEPPFQHEIAHNQHRTAPTERSSLVLQDRSLMVYYAQFTGENE
ncbi:glycogen debranching protein GlgX [Shewanella psychrotolerans]|uniref:glycogen debranching protein GlgX n=1 Tax=Shewanella psychrotolerans TaxID=2864206 RepID=UPI001C65D7C7|nr:glycogen debranching protein GlgX [Shewanella psychrotolerans]QYK02340.1 glycogen debranching protein GlgX [Shewanella psychrotolerans]